MLASQIPAKFPIPFANNAGGAFTRPVPQASQVGIQAGAASLFDGFPPSTFNPIASGGIPPFGADFNGLLNQITAWNQWYSAGGPVVWDAAFSSAVGGYPNGAIVGSAIVQGNQWLSTADNNASNPDAGGANWIINPSTMGTGHWQWRPVAGSLTGWVVCNGLTIGSATSGANFASATAQLLYIYLWNNFTQAQCPVTGGRGASGLADFNSNKPIGTYDMRATGMFGVDTMGNASTGLLAGVPAVSGSASQVASILGSSLVTLIANQLPSSIPYTDIGHAHTYQLASGSNNYGVSTSFAFNGTNPASTSTNGTGITINPSGGNPHNNTERNALGYIHIKL